MRLGILILSLFWITAISLSCRKENPPKAVIAVIDTGGIAQPNVKVTVFSGPNGSYIDPQSEIRLDSARTNSSGEVMFTFKNKAIFQVKAEQYTTQYHRDGSKLLILEEGQTVSLTIIVK